MMTESGPCELCDEARSAATWITSTDSRMPAEGNYSRLIRRSAVVDIIAGLGSIVPGYVLVVPRAHVLSLGELTEQERASSMEIAWDVAREIENTFSSPVILVEHGSSRLPGKEGGACIDHAHLHIFPLPNADAKQDFIVQSSVHVLGLDPLSDSAAAGLPYYYCSWRKNEGHLATNPSIGPQYARQLWARAAGRPNEWDWTLFPNLENCMNTAEVLRRDRLGPNLSSLPESETVLDETLTAYNDSAAWYAQRTSAFDGTGILEAEMTALLQETKGVVLDAGSGAGRDAAFMASSDRMVIAMDAASSLLRLTPSAPNLETKVGDIRNIPLPDASVGAIWCSAVLLHLDQRDCQRAIHELFRVLTPGGMAHVSVKEGGGHSKQLMGDDSGRYRHFYFYERETIVRLASEAGFVLVRTWIQEQEDSSDTLHQWRKFLFRKA